MGELKTGWTRVKFGDVVRLGKESCKNPLTEGIHRYIALEHMTPNDLKVRSWGEIADGTTFTRRCRPGQVLFGKRRAYQRKVAVCEFDALCSGDIYVFESKDAKRLLPRLLPYICQTEAFFEFAVGTSAGSLSPRTNWKSLANYEFARPPLDRQAKIAEMLLASDAFREDLQRTLRAVANARLSIRDSVTALDGSRSQSLGLLCEMQNGRPFPSKQYRDDGIRLLRPGNLAPDGTMSWTDEKTVCLPDAWVQEAPDHVIRRGDVCINLTAQSLEDGFMGRVVMAREADKCLLNQRIGRFVAIHEDVRPEWLFRVLQSTRFLQHAASRCEGTKVQHLFWSHLEDFEVPVPPLAEQDIRLAVVRELDEAVAATRRRLAEHEAAHQALRESLLNPTALGGVS